MFWKIEKLICWKLHVRPIKNRWCTYFGCWLSQLHSNTFTQMKSVRANRCYMWKVLFEMWRERERKSYLFFFSSFFCECEFATKNQCKNIACGNRSQTSKANQRVKGLTVLYINGRELRWTPTEILMEIAKLLKMSKRNKSFSVFASCKHTSVGFVQWVE